jgi:hypothetical protein
MAGACPYWRFCELLANLRDKEVSMREVSSKMMPAIKRGGSVMNKFYFDLFGEFILFIDLENFNVRN